MKELQPIFLNNNSDNYDSIKTKIAFTEQCDPIFKKSVPTKQTESVDRQGQKYVEFEFENYKDSTINDSNEDRAPNTESTEEKNKIMETIETQNDIQENTDIDNYNYNLGQNKNNLNNDRQNYYKENNSNSMAQIKKSLKRCYSECNYLNVKQLSSHNIIEASPFENNRLNNNLYNNNYCEISTKEDDSSNRIINYSLNK